MGAADRHYYQMPSGGSHHGGGQPSRLQGSPVVKWLMIINIAVFVIDVFLKELLFVYGHFSVATVFEHGQVWRFFSFQFLHADLGHLFFNMFALYMFGAFVEHWWSSRRFLVFYLVCGSSGALLYSILYELGLFGKSPLTEYIPLVGASAGIYACLIAVAVIAPNLQIRLLFPPIPMKMRTFALGVLAIAVIMTFSNGINAGGEAGHLGGAIVGFLLMKHPYLLRWVGEAGGSGGHARGGRRTVDATIVREKKIRPKIHINMDDSEVDRILDKVNREGIQSLTEKEREVLRRSAGQ